MLRYARGSLLDANVEALVNTVNTVGVMGKGIALQVKEAYPEVDSAYRAACARGEVRVGRMQVVRTGSLHGPAFVINFPTKEHWRQPSKLDYVTRGLKDLKRVIVELGIRSVALPPLGCGSGGLDWALVRPAIARELQALPDVDVLVFEPAGAHPSAPKRAGVEELTPARALIVEAVRRYGVLGFECSNLEIQKLAYFAQRVMNGLGLRDVLDLKFVAHLYGPYSDRLRHTLSALDGSYLHCEKRLADAGPMEPIVLDLPRLTEIDRSWRTPEVEPYRVVIDRLEQIIDGFQTPLLMELLATVDWILRDDGPDVSPAEVRKRLGEWPGGRSAGQRKLRLFGVPDVPIAMERLRLHRGVLYGTESGRRTW